MTTEVGVLGTVLAATSAVFGQLQTLSTCDSDWYCCSEVNEWVFAVVI
jgi:hypothetical protein